jgi:hypothetical protein
VFKQKVKHLLHEHKTRVEELNAGNVAALQLAADQHHRENLDVRKEKRALKEELKRQQLAHEEFVKAVKKVCQRFMARTCISARALSAIASFSDVSLGNSTRESLIKDAERFE